MAAGDHRTECFDCAHKRDVHNNAHKKCVNPDPNMVGDQHGINNGWFDYPDLFDPTWKVNACSNFEPKD